MFEKAKNIFKLQRDTKQVKKELQNIHIESEVDGIVVLINGEQDIISIIWPSGMFTEDKKLQHGLVKAINKGLKKSQQIAAGKMKGIMGSLGWPST